MLTGHPPSSRNPSIYEINHELPFLDFLNLKNKSIFERRKDGTGGLTTFKTLLPAVARDLYKVPAVMELYEKRKEFDLIVVNHIFNEVSAEDDIL